MEPVEVRHPMQRLVDELDGVLRALEHALPGSPDAWRLESEERTLLELIDQAASRRLQLL